MNKSLKNFTRILCTITFSCVTIFYFYSCQKANPNPYSLPQAGVTHTIVPTYTSTSTHDTTTTPADTNPSFKASVNSGPVITFTPSKSISGGNTTLKGTSTYYTITITFPTSSTGPGNYEIGFPSSTISAEVNNGGTIYVCNYYNGDGGQLYIDSISSKGKYYGTFNFVALDSATVTFMQVNQGSFYHL